MEYLFAMLPIQEEKIRNIFASAKFFAVISDKEAAEEILLAKEALIAAIRNTGLLVHFFPERQSVFIEKWRVILPSEDNSLFAFSTSILIPKNKTGIKEISYTEDNKYVNINISASEEISKENVLFKTAPAKIDAIFYFSFDQKQLGEKLTEELSQKIIIPESDNIITVAPGSNGETISEKIFNIIQIIESSGDISVNKPLVSDLLLASLFIETDQFQKNLNEGALGLAASLIKLGADKEKIAGLINDKSPSFARLLGRAMARSYPNESLKSMWTFVAEQDLEKTGHEPNPALFEKIMKKIKSLLEHRPVFVLIWQSRQKVWAMVSVSLPNKEEAMGKIRAFLPAKNNSLSDGSNLVSGPYKNFSEAELKIQDVLKEIV